MSEEIITKKKSSVREYTEAIFTAFMVAFLIRSFGIEAFKIPSGSMIPTLMVGDHIFVNKFIYGLRIPFTKKKIISFRNPERGEPIVFMYPVDESKDFIKRVIGLPGDRINIQGDEVIINGEPLVRKTIHTEPDRPADPKFLKVIPEAEATQLGVHDIPTFEDWEDYQYYLEHVGSVDHLTQYDSRPSHDHGEFIVPPDRLFVMGDNRDNSLDSRSWGFVPLENVKGKAMFIWLSINYDRHNLRWDRFGKWIH